GDAERPAREEERPVGTAVAVHPVPRRADRGTGAGRTPELPRQGGRGGPGEGPDGGACRRGGGAARTGADGRGRIMTESPAIAMGGPGRESISVRVEMP